MSEEKGKRKLPSLDGLAENYDKWKIKWAAFAEVEGLSDALGDCMDPNMPESSVSVLGKDAAGKLQVGCGENKQESNGLPGIGF